MIDEFNSDDIQPARSRFEARKAPGNYMTINGSDPILYINAGSEVPDWGVLGVDLVVDATRNRNTTEELGVHIENGAKSVLRTAPTQDTEAWIVGVSDKDEPVSKPHQSGFRLAVLKQSPLNHLHLFRRKNGFLPQAEVSLAKSDVSY